MMRKQILYAAVFSLAVILVGDVGMTAPKKSNRGRGNISIQQNVSVTPSSVATPVTAEESMSVCVSGFEQGNFVTVAVPWVGTPDYHSNLSFSDYIDSTGGFCVDSPPDWTALNLEPGNYEVQVSMSSNGRNSSRQTMAAGFSVY